jgi:serine protease Do
VTAGIVSAKGRSLPRENYVPFIQTDVAINPGNSGGPLFNLAGEVVGINSQIFSGTGGFMGLSFAIPIEVAMNVVTQLRERGRVSRGWLGVLIDDVSPGMAESLGMDRPQGAWIAKVLPDGPAASAGLVENDIVLEFDGNIVSRSSDLPPIVGRTPVGTRVPVKVLRDGEARTLYVLTAELPGEDEIRLAVGRTPEPTTIAALGIEVAEPTPEQRRQWGLSEGGVLVTEVEEGPAYRAGLRPGDLILSVEGANVNGAGELLDLTEHISDDQEVSILAQRRGEIIAFTLPGG